MPTYRMSLNFLLGAICCGIVISLIRGLYERRVLGIPEVRYYGYPLVWRLVNMNGPTEYVLVNLVIDAVIWITASLVALLLLNQVATHLHQTYPTDIRLDTVGGANERQLRIVLSYLLVLALVMKVAGEFVHEALGHGLFAILFGGKIVRLDISPLWPYRLSGIEIRGDFKAWQLPWIDGGRILVCLVVSSFIQGLLLWNVKHWYITASLFWLAF